MKRVCLIFLLLMSAGGPFAAEQAKPDFLVFNGLCDASAAVALDDKHFVVASDEDSKLRVYRLDSPRLPVQVFDMHAFLELDQEHPETDIEAAASLGGIVYWITSHGRNVEGKVRPSRERLFATRIVPSAAGYEIIPIGNACKNLLTSMKNDSRLDRLGLSMAATKAPKDAGGLNIEGLAATPDGKLLIGFRNPVPGKLALVVPLLNPTEVIAGGRPRLGDPLQVDLGGLGIRDMVRIQNGFLLIGGPTGGKPEGRGFKWDGISLCVTEVARVKGAKFNPEALVVFESDKSGRVLLLSDDGTRRLYGCECKKLKNEWQREFRAAWLDLSVGR